MSDSQCTVAEPAIHLPGSKVMDASGKSEWRKVDANPQLAIYIDDASAVSLSTTVSVWLKVVYQTSRRAPHVASTYISDIGAGTYDCKDQTFYEGMRWVYDAQGNAIDLLPPSPPAQHLRSDGPIAASFEALCQKK
jgi:hypothetical protein